MGAQDASHIESAETIAAGLDETDYFDMRVWFEFDSAELTPNAYIALDELGEAINTNNLFDFVAGANRNSRFRHHDHIAIQVTRNLRCS